MDGPYATVEEAVDSYRELTALKTENERLREALKPFARYAEDLDHSGLLGRCPLVARPQRLARYGDVTVGDLRRARAALDREKNDG